MTAALDWSLRMRVHWLGGDGFWERARVADAVRRRAPESRKAMVNEDRFSATIGVLLAGASFRVGSAPAPWIGLKRDAAWNGLATPVGPTSRHGAGPDEKPPPEARPEFVGGSPELATPKPGTVFVRENSREQREGWRGRVGYEFRVRYCGLTPNSWMWQSVLIYEWGHEDPTLKFTYNKIYATEIFKVGADGCTIAPDKHYSFVHLSNDARTSVCPLCDYCNFRSTIQYDGVSVTGDTGSGDHKGWFPEGDPDQEWIAGEDADYHLLSFKREGTPCLGRSTPLDVSAKLLQASPSSGKLAGSWTYQFWWALPCTDWIIPDRLREPKDPAPSPNPPPLTPTDAKARDPVITPRTPDASGLVLEPNKPHTKFSKPFGPSQPTQPGAGDPVQPSPKEPQPPGAPGGGR